MQNAPKPAQRLKLARPQFRPVGGRFSPISIRGPGALASRAAGFAAALQARHAGITGPYRGQGLVYRQNALGVFLQRIHRHSHLTLAPRLQLAFQSTAERPARLQRVQAPSRQPQSHPLWLTPARQAIPTPALRPAAISNWQAGLMGSAETGTRSLEILHLAKGISWLTLRVNPQAIQRLVGRLERIETVRRYAASTGYPEGQTLPARVRFTQPVQAALPVQQVLLKKAGVVIREDDRVHEIEQHHPPNRLPGWPSPAWESPGFPPTEMSIQRLADRVVQVIDDRVIARRERMGRI